MVLFEIIGVGAFGKLGAVWALSPMLDLSDSRTPSDIQMHVTKPVPVQYVSRNDW